MHSASWDYRAVSSHASSAEADADHAQPMHLVHHDQPGAYAYETPAQAERRVLIQQQSLQAERKRFEGTATVRTLQPGTTFTLLEHAEHDGGLAQGSQRLIEIRKQARAERWSFVKHMEVLREAGVVLIRMKLVTGDHAPEPGRARRIPRAGLY